MLSACPSAGSLADIDHARFMQVSRIDQRLRAVIRRIIANQYLYVLVRLRKARRERFDQQLGAGCTSAGIWIFSSFS